MATKAKQKKIDVIKEYIIRHPQTNRLMGKVQICQSAPKQFYSRIFSSNGNEMWRTSEVYKTAAGARKSTRACCAIFAWAWASNTKF